MLRVRGGLSAFASQRLGPASPRHFTHHRTYVTLLERDVEAALDAYRVPGLGCAVINEGREVLCRGFGVRNIERDGAVDADTLFAIGSVSKSFTAAAVAMLVDEGAIDWDTRVIDRLPS